MNENSTLNRYFAPVLEHEIEVIPRDRHLLYARGYALTVISTKLDLGSHWAEEQIRGVYLHWDRRQPVAISSSPSCDVIIIGRALSVHEATPDLAGLAAHLLAAREKSRTEYLRELDDVAGRYVVIDSGVEGLFIQTDATAMRSAFYALPGVVASHARLAADIRDHRRSSKFRLNKWMGTSGAFTFPGHYTEWEDVYLLTPNTELNIQSGEIRRIGPDAITEPLSPACAAEKLLPLLQNQLRALAEKSPLLVSLTAGLDSRVTMALCRPLIDRVEFFTYARPYLATAQSSQADMDVARDLVHGFGLNHTELTIESADVDRDLANIFVHNCDRAHGRVLSATYRKKLPADRVHVRSNLYEIGRSFYRGSGNKDLPELDAQQMANVLVRRSKADAQPEVVEAFQEWMNISEWSGVEGYDPYDLYYWEHRMAAWLNSVMIESDVAHDTYTVINSRSILRLFLSVTRENRANASVFDHLVKLAWPEVFDYPVNGRLRKVPGD
ncbi:hypothetical protein ACT3UQ_18780 [Glutamicibacter sp. AOP12-B1-11]|uniref:hypothetical protein n=1 Tax=Micrococcaceae TaxID=1268 RepID=UPI0011B02D81|nr:MULTISPECIES: hypothetical protein [unclassified Arthrobacter]